MFKPLIALDWGTTRARAFLISEDGRVLQRRLTDRGIQSVAAGGYPAAFEALAGELRRAAPDAAIVLAGMVGSRNGWVKAPYVATARSSRPMSPAPPLRETSRRPASPSISRRIPGRRSCRV